VLQEIFRIPFINRPVYGYGLMLVIGFLLGAQLAKFLARRCGFNGENFITACLFGLVAGVVGARLSHVFESLASHNHEFSDNGKSLLQNLGGMLDVSSGGLTFYGGFLLATPVMMWYAIHKKIPLLKGMDIIAPCLMIGLGFGRIGCYLNGCCYGEECSWGVQFPYGSNAYVEQYEMGELDNVSPALTDPTTMVPLRPLEPGHARTIDPNIKELPRLLSKQEIQRQIEKINKLSAAEKEKFLFWQADLAQLKQAGELRAKAVLPTELYSSFNAFLIAAVLYTFFSTQPPAGQVFALMLMLKGTSRYILEMVRVEPPVFENLSFSMVVSVFLVIAGIWMWWACGRRQKNQDGRHFAVAPAA
jgi:phosphatidylglycerol:prolipoprotein diacylglycerol transferase